MSARTLLGALIGCLAMLVSGLVSGVADAAPPPPTALVVEAPENNSGLNLNVTWTEATGPASKKTLGHFVLRAPREGGPYEVVSSLLPAGKDVFSDKVTSDPGRAPPADSYWYRVVAVDRLLDVPAPDAGEDEEARYIAELFSTGGSSAATEGHPQASLFRGHVGHLLLLAIIFAVGGLSSWFTRQAQAGKPIFIRRIAGIDAIEEGIGRATEMGRPVLYVPGIDELQDIQTIASMLILGQVAETVAEYQADIIVSCCIPIVREVADEVVRGGYYQAGYPDAFNPANVRFISSAQFAFCAGTNGIMLREKPATNIYFGRFFAESLILAETGFVNRSIQIAGTAEATQLPFFIAACDYTLIGEELFAVSAYLSKDPRLVSSLKASDWIKVFVVTSLLVGTFEVVVFGSTHIITAFTIVGE